MTTTALNILIVIGLVIGFVLAQAGLINWPVALILVVGGAIGAAVLYPHAFPRNKS